MHTAIMSTTTKLPFAWHQYLTKINECYRRTPNHNSI